MSKTLVAYFSAGGTTEKVAKKLAEAVGADLFAIRPEKEYTQADLKWTNPLARCNREKFGGKDVPVAGKVKDMAGYDLVLLGFPIWYYAAPNIIGTFLKGYDFSGKSLALFATSGGSDMGKTAEKLKPLLSDSAQILGAKLFQPSVDSEALKQWAESLL